MEIVSAMMLFLNYTMNQQNSTFFLIIMHKAMRSSTPPGNQKHIDYLILSTEPHKKYVTTSSYVSLRSFTS